MSAYRKTRKELSRRIAALEKQSRNARYTSQDEANQASSEYYREIGELEEELNVVESSRLRKKAMRFGVDLNEGFGPWMTHAVIPGRKWLEEKEQSKAHRAIREAQMEWWRKWITLLSPVASVIIALLAFALAALALYLQITGKLPRPVAPAAAQQETSNPATH
jgi:hypothetical protein